MARNVSADSLDMDEKDAEDLFGKKNLLWPLVALKGDQDLDHSADEATHGHLFPPVSPLWAVARETASLVSVKNWTDPHVELRAWKDLRAPMPAINHRDRGAFNINSHSYLSGEQTRACLDRIITEQMTHEEFKETKITDYWSFGKIFFIILK